jgi:hypothetical protein
MSDPTDAARRAYRRVDRRFLALQTARDKLEAALAASFFEDDTLFAEWEDACWRFRRAHEEWRAVAWCRAKPPTEPVIDLSALEFDASDLAV